MKQAAAILVALFISPACHRPEAEIKKRISGSDSMAVNYFGGDGTADTVIAVKITHDRNKIEQMAAFISESAAEGNYKCGYDGSVHFFKMNSVIQDVYFRMIAGCMYFFFLQDGQPRATALPAEAKELISSLRK